MTDSSPQPNTKATSDTQAHSSPTNAPRRPWRWVLRVALIIALILGVGAGIKAYRWHDMDRLERGAFIQERAQARISDKLDLNATQEQQLRSLLNHVAQQRQALDLPAWRARALGTLSGPRMDQAAAQQLLLDMAQRLQTEAPAMVEQLAAFYDGLTPQQQAQVRERLSRR